VFITPAVVGDAVLIGSCSGTFYALDRATGEVLWEYHTGEVYALRTSVTSAPTERSEGATD
jgi:outer membrane protein assembly factor BamB